MTPDPGLKQPEINGYGCLIIIVVIAVTLGIWQCSKGSGTDPSAQLSPVTAQASVLSSEDLYRAIRPALVRINAIDERGRPIGHGSGFFASADGKVVTNHHVIEKASALTVTCGSGHTYQVEGLLALDPELDLAIVKIAGKNLSYLSLNPQLPAQGAEVFALGNPVGMDFTISNGIVSNLARSGSRQHIVTTAPISPGSSGGPLVDRQGRVVGIVRSTRKDAQNINFAIPSQYAQELLRKRPSLQRFPETPRDKVLQTDVARALQIVNDDPATARAIWLRLEDRLRDSPQYWIMRASTDIRLRRFDDAKRSLGIAIELDPDGRDAHLVRWVQTILEQAETR